MSVTPPRDDFHEVTLESPRGILTAWARSGSGVPIVLVHGVMADAASWKPVAEHVAPDRPSLIVNRRGRSPSAALDRDYSVDDEIADLLLWLTTLNGPVDLFGHSFGGLIAVEAVRRGANVRTLVLYEPVARPFGREVLAALGSSIKAGDLDSAVEIINVDLSGYSHDHVAALRSGPAWERLRELAEPAGHELRAIDCFDFKTPEVWDVPTTLIAGELSRHRFPYGPSVDLYREALALEVAILAGQDHIGHVTAPLELAAIVGAALG